jgi:acetolactate synthase-1/2/3 large subunit
MTCIQELATLAELHLNVSVIILNNGHLGLVRQQQELFYDQTYIACKFMENPNFTAIARGFGLRGIDLGHTAHPETVLAELLAQSGPRVINVPIRPDENVLPMVPPGAANIEMIGG